MPGISQNALSRFHIYMAGKEMLFIHRKIIFKEIRKPFSAISQVLGFPHDILALRTLQ
jgi:hypothetical protein